MYLLCVNLFIIYLFINFISILHVEKVDAPLLLTYTCNHPSLLDLQHGSCMCLPYTSIQQFKKSKRAALC